MVAWIVAEETDQGEVNSGTRGQRLAGRKGGVALGLATRPGGGRRCGAGGGVCAGRERGRGESHLELLSLEPHLVLLIVTLFCFSFYIFIYLFVYGARGYAKPWFRKE